MPTKAVDLEEVGQNLDYLTKDVQDLGQQLEDAEGHLSRQIRIVNVKLHRMDVKNNVRFDLIDRRFDIIDQKFLAVEKRFDRVEQRLDQLEGKINALAEAVGILIEQIKTKLH